MREFKDLFEKLGYTFQSADVLEDVYSFYKYYNNIANKGVASILLEGDPGSGKTFLSEIFSQFLGDNTVYIYTQCVEETNSDRLIATYNVPAIVKGDADKSISEGILTKAINFANSGKKVVLTIDELDKAREVLDSYFLDFLQNGKIETSSNEILMLTEEGRKNLYVILAKNNERDLSDALLRRCSVIKLPPMPPVLAYKTLLRKFEEVEHDSKFLKFICKVYEAIYNEQMSSGEELLSRLPALQELVTAITSDNELYKNNVSSTRRINSMIRKLGKDTESRDIITSILTKKFKYQNRESNYSNGILDLDMNNPNDYMSTRDASSLIEQYIENKDSGGYDSKDEFDDPMKDIANILDNMRDDPVLVFVDKKNKEKIVELGVITHKDPRALDVLFNKIKDKGNPNSRFGFLNFEGDNFIGLIKYKNTLVLVSNKEYVSPRLLISGLSVIIRIIHDSDENIDNGKIYFSPVTADDFKLSGLNAKILSKVPNFVLDKMGMQNGVYVYDSNNLKIIYDDSLDVSYFEYFQKHRAEPIFEAIASICRFNPELAIPASFVDGRKFSCGLNRELIAKYSDFLKCKKEWENLGANGWDVEIEDFELIRGTEDFVFKWVKDEDSDNRRLHVYPKYKLKDGYLLYTSDKDFEQDDFIRQLDSFQREIAEIARNIFGNFVPQRSRFDYFSSSTMSVTGRIVEDKTFRDRVFELQYDITSDLSFVRYYDSISEPSVVIAPIAPSKVMTRKL